MRVLVNGAAGRMGREVVRAVSAASDMEVVAGVDLESPQDLENIPFFTDLAKAIGEVHPQVVVDFTRHDVLEKNLDTCMKLRVPAVVGTTGLNEEEIERLRSKGAACGWKALIAPNFAIGAVLMMRFAEEAARFFPEVEIIEYHHEQKKDAPSGTAIKTAEIIAQVRGDVRPDDSWEKIEGARGGRYKDISIHSIRLPGFVAHQEVIFGLPGQNLTIRHDSTHRESFMPGVLLAIRNLDRIDGVVYGLEEILFS